MTVLESRVGVCVGLGGIWGRWRGGEGSSEKWRLQFGDFKGLHGI